MRQFNFRVYAPDAESALQTVLSYDAVANYGRFVPVYNPDLSRITIHLDVPVTEEGCYEELLKRSIGAVTSLHVPQLAPEALRCAVIPFDVTRNAGDRSFPDINGTYGDIATRI